MNGDTINDAVTMAGREGALLAGRYRIVRQLGQGGMGSVWLAEDTQLDNKQFAIKMLPSILVSNKRAYRQLKDEALVAMRLVHPNIVQLRAFEENNGNPFLVMDYIDGEPLDYCLGEWGLLSEDQAAALLRPVAAALDYAHRQGVVHRDVKPGNVMVRKDGVPFVLDFGIAREIQETLTRVTGKLSSGTLLYMSPEQLNGEAPAPAQDIYSFAAMAYECMKGEPPFVRGAIEDQIKNKQPTPLIGCIGRNGANSIARSVMAGLAKNPKDRPTTCMAMLRGQSSAAGGTRRSLGGLTFKKFLELPRPLLYAASAVVGIFAVAVVLALAWPSAPQASAVVHHGVTRQQVDDKKREAEAALLALSGVFTEETARRECERIGESAKDEYANEKWESAYRLYSQMGKMATDALIRTGTKKGADAAKTEANNARDAAVAAEAAKYDNVGLTNAVVAVEDGDKAYSKGEYKAAIGKFNAARKAFEACTKKATAKIRKMAEDSRKECESERDKTKDLGATELVSKQWQEAERLKSEGESAFRKGEYSGADEAFRRAKVAYLEAAKGARKATLAALHLAANNAKDMADKCIKELSNAGAETYASNAFNLILADYASGTNAVACEVYVQAKEFFENVCKAFDGCRQVISDAKEKEQLVQEAERRKITAEESIEKLCESDAEIYGGDAFAAILKQYDSGTNALASKAYSEANKCFDGISAAYEACMLAISDEKEKAAATLLKDAAEEALSKVKSVKGDELDPVQWATATNILAVALGKFEGREWTEAQRGFEETKKLFDATLTVLPIAKEAFDTRKEALQKRKEAEPVSAQRNTVYWVSGNKHIARGDEFLKQRDFEKAKKSYDDAAKSFCIAAMEGMARVSMDAALAAQNNVRHQKDIKSPSVVKAWNEAVRELHLGNCEYTDRNYVEAKKRYETGLKLFKEILVGKSVDVSASTTLTKTLTLPGGVTMEFIYVVPGSFYAAPGSFTRRSSTSKKWRNNGETRRCVTLTKGFWLGKYEVTQGQWQSVMGGNPSDFKSDDKPVDYVSWRDCQQFIQKVNAQLNCGARLPTEAEWEYACRAGTTTAYNWGSVLNGDKANCNGNYPYGTTVKGPYKRETTPVGSYAANAWGFYDMHGNVSEWCQDVFEEWLSTDPMLPSPAMGEDLDTARVLRGGCWNNDAWSCRSVDRDWRYADCRENTCGFRLCCSAGEVVSSEETTNVAFLKPVVKDSKPYTGRRGKLPVDAAQDKESGQYVIENCVLKSANLHGVPELVVPDGVKSISSFIFKGIKFKRVVIPSSVTSLSAAFDDYSIEELHISDIASWCNIQSGTSTGWPTKGADLYLNGERVRDLIIPGSVHVVKSDVFMDCRSLEGVILKEGVQGIGGYAFYGCGNIAKVSIPSTLTNINNFAFSFCKNLSSILVAADNPVFEIKSGLLCDKINKRVILGPNSLVNVRIPNGIKTIEASAFCGNDRLETVCIPIGLETIGEYAFSSCRHLKSMSIPAGLKHIGREAFSYCVKIEELSVPDTVTDIDDGAFKGCSNLKKVVLPRHFKGNIKDTVFKGCSLVDAIEYGKDVN